MGFRKSVAAVFILFALAGCALKTASQVPWGSGGEAFWLDGLWPHGKSDLPRRPDALYGRLDNGLRYIILKNARPEGRAEIHLDVQVGSLMERDDELGLAHFLEHMAFNGSKHFPPGELIPYFQKNGMAFGRDANAHTSYQETVFKLSLATTDDANMRRGLLIMRDVADGLSILPEEVDKERGVILSEKAARDSEAYRAGRRLRQNIYDGTRFLNDPIGQEEIIKEASSQTIKGFYDAWYRPELMVVVVVGDVRPEAVKRLVAEGFADLAPHGQPRAPQPWGDVKLQGLVPYYDQYESQSTNVRIGAMKPRHWRDDSLELQRRMALGAMANAIVSHRLREHLSRGEAPYLKAFVRESDAFNLFPSANIMAQCEPGQWRATLTVLQEELARGLGYGFLPSEVDRVRAELLRSYELRAKREADMPHDKVAETIVACVNGNRVYQSWKQTRVMYEGFFEQATPETLHHVFREMWDSDNRIVSVTGNAAIEGDAKAVITEAWNKGLALKVAAPAEAEALNYPYVPEPKQPGAEFKMRSTALGAGSLQLFTGILDNGLRVSLLPTPFQKDQINVSLHLGGGTDAVPDADHDRFVLAAMADNYSGIGRLDSEQSSRLFAEGGYRVGSNLGSESYVISGGGQTGNLEDILRAMWTQFRDPELDQSGHERMLKTLRMADQGRDKDVPTALRTESRLYFWGDDLRTRPMTEARGQAVPFEALGQALRQLAAPKGAVLNMVGDFDPQSAARVINRFFGSPEVRFGPAPKRAHAHVPAFPAPAEPERSFSVDAGLNQAALVVAYHRDHGVVSDRRTLAMRRMLASILRDRLRRTVREELGASYSPGMVYFTDDQNGYGMYQVRIGTQPDKLDLLKQTVIRILDQAAAQGVRPDELERMRRPALTGWQKRQRDNRTFIQLLDLSATRGLPYLEWNEAYPEELASITVDELSAEAKAAFAPSRRAVLTGTEAPNKN